jgi:P27 family predicted phage terminase small subunit
MSGRPRKSIELHVQHGTRPHAPQIKAPSPLVAGRPKFPRHLSKEGRRAFKHACALLEQRRTLTPGDEEMLALYATLHERWVALKEQLGTNFLIVVTILDSHGNPHEAKRVNPLVRMVSDCESKLLAVVKTLGLSPTDSRRTQPTAIDPMNEIVPGSLADTHPELFSGNVVPFVPTPIAPPTELEDEQPSENG